MIFGMAAFATLSGRLPEEEGCDAWRSYLEDGPDRLVPVEAFPSATVQYLRQPRNQDARIAICRIVDGIEPGRGQSEEPVVEARKLVRAAVRGGPRRLKRDDRAAALVASLSTLPTVFPGQFRAVPMTAPEDSHGAKHKASGRGREGAITLVAPAGPPIEP